jgi:hypothetical protein
MRLDVAVGELTDRLARGMKLGDALVLWAAEECRPKVGALLTWNARHFEGRTDLLVQTPQEWLRGRR